MPNNFNQTHLPQELSLLERISELAPALSPSERRVAHAVLAAPNNALSMAIGELAAAAQASQPTVARFCRALGFAGIKHFKLALAKSLAMSLPAPAGVPFVHQAVRPNDSAAEVAAKVFDSSISTLLAVRNQLDATTLEAAIDALASAKRIEFYGAGNSGLVALDAQHKFFRLGVPVVAYTDPHIHAQAAALLCAGDVALLISRGGRSSDLLDSAQTAREQGATVLAITAAGSPLAKLGHIAILVDAPEDPDIYTPMTSRLAQLAVVDVLSVGVALRRGPEMASALERARLALAGKRQASKSVAAHSRNGVPLLVKAASTEAVTSQLVNQLRDELE